MNYLENWMDISKLSMTGWGGSKDFDSAEHCLVLNATNGWESIYWTISAIQDREVYFEFDYKFTNLDNAGWCFIINNNSYGNDNIMRVNLNTNWTHVRVKVSCTTPYIGINIRGTDGTGKSFIMAIKNVRLYLSVDVVTNQLQKTGNVITEEAIEDNMASVYPSSIYFDNFIEN